MIKHDLKAFKVSNNKHLLYRQHKCACINRHFWFCPPGYQNELSSDLLLWHAVCPWLWFFSYYISLPPLLNPSSCLHLTMMPTSRRSVSWISSGTAMLGRSMTCRKLWSGKIKKLGYAQRTPSLLQHLMLDLQKWWSFVLYSSVEYPCMISLVFYSVSHLLCQH